MTLLIMAAGLGSRYGGLKQLDGIGPSSELIIEYSIYDAIQAGFDKVVFIIREEHKEAFEEKIASKVRSKIKVDYAFQNTKNVPAKYDSVNSRTKPLGTGHAILCAKDVIGNDDFAVINADDFYSRDAFVQIADFLKANDSHCLAGYKLSNTVSENGTVSRGVCYVDENGLLSDILEHEKIDNKFKNNAEPFVTLTADTIVSMNAWGFKSSMFATFEKEFLNFLEDNKEDLSKCEFYLTYPVKKIIENEKVVALDTSAKWYGVTYQEDKDEVTKAIRKMVDANIYPERLWS